MRKEHPEIGYEGNSIRARCGEGEGPLEEQRLGIGSSRTRGAMTAAVEEDKEEEEEEKETGGSGTRLGESARSGRGGIGYRPSSSSVSESPRVKSLRSSNTSQEAERDGTYQGSVASLEGLLGASFFTFVALSPGSISFFPILEAVGGSCFSSSDSSFFSALNLLRMRSANNFSPSSLGVK